jgi:hypothetical protein
VLTGVEPASEMLCALCILQTEDCVWHNYCIYPNVRWPYVSDNPHSLSWTFRKIPTQNMFNSVHSCQVTSHFSDVEFGKCQYYIWVSTALCFCCRLDMRNLSDLTVTVFYTPVSFLKIKIVIFTAILGLQQEYRREKLYQNWFILYFKIKNWERC